LGARTQDKIRSQEKGSVVHIKSEEDLLQLLLLAGIDPRKRGWNKNRRNGVRRLFQQTVDGEGELRLYRSTRKVKLWVTCTIPEDGRKAQKKKQKQKQKQKMKTVIFLEHKYAPDGTRISEEPDIPGEKLRSGEKPRDGCVRLLAEEFGIAGRLPSEFTKVKKVQAMKPSTRSFPGLESRTLETIFWWEMPYELYKRIFKEKKLDGSFNVFRAYAITAKVLEQIKALK
jgi:hypothetical protein